MKFAKNILMVPALLFSFTVAAMALNPDGDKKTPKKPEPPVVIVFLDKKKNEKPKEGDGKKGVASLVFSLINSFE